VTRQLDERECWSALRHASVGRVAIVVDGKPEIFPVNHVVDAATVVFRTAAGTKLRAAAERQPAAFEVDGWEEHEAYSVVVHGRLSQITHPEQLIETLGLSLAPWESSPKGSFVRLEPDRISGRRFVRVGPGHWAPDPFDKW